MDLSRYRREFDDYCSGIISGEIPAGRLLTLAVQRHLDDIEHGAERGLYFDHDSAARACAFFPATLRHSKGTWAGKPFHLTPSEVFIIYSVWGWRVTATKARRFSEALVMVARKWGKSEIASGCALRHATCDDPLDPGAEVYLAATKEDQVRKTTFQQCTRMVNKSSFLSRRIQVGKKALVVHDNDKLQPGSAIYPIGSDSNTSDGFDCSAAILDELHAWQKFHEGFYERMTTGGGSREQELVWFFTTEGDDKSELLKSIKESAVRALESVETRRFDSGEHIFAFIAQIDDDDHPFECEADSPELEVMVRKANPNYPTTPRPHYIRRKFVGAKGNALEQNKILRFLFNRRVSSSVQPINEQRWIELSRPLTIPDQGAVGAFDLGRSNDFCAWAVVWFDGDYVCVKSQSYTCAERSKPLATRDFLRFVETGELIEHSGNCIDFGMFQADILELANTHNIYTWCYDPHYSLQMAQNLMAELGEDAVFKFNQNPSMYNEPSRDFVKRFNAGTIRPDANSCMAWQFRNLAFKRNAKDEWMPDKGIGQEFKIDCCVACLMGFRLLTFDSEPKASFDFYEHNDVELV